LSNKAAEDLEEVREFCLVDRANTLGEEDPEELSSGFLDESPTFEDLSEELKVKTVLGLPSECRILDLGVWFVRLRVVPGVLGVF